MMPNDSSLYTATTAGLAALKTSVYSTARVLEALIASNAITREVAIAIVDDMERDARYTITGAPELGPVIDLHYQTARKALCIAQGD